MASVLSDHIMFGLCDKALLLCEISLFVILEKSFRWKGGPEEAERGVTSLTALSIDSSPSNAGKLLLVNKVYI